MVAATVAALGGLHVAVNNAGVNHNSAAEETPVGEWDATFALNARGVFLCCQVARSGRDTPRDAPEMHPRCAACSCAARRLCLSANPLYISANSPHNSLHVPSSVLLCSQHEGRHMLAHGISANSL